MVFTRDLRVDDNPALCAAANAGTMSCLFVVDDKFAGAPGASQRRQTFLLQSLSDLDHSLRKLGAHLEVVYGDWSQQVQQRALELGASNIHLSEDYSFYAKRRLANLKSWCRDVLPRSLRVRRGPPRRRRRPHARTRARRAA